MTKIIISIQLLFSLFLSGHILPAMGTNNLINAGQDVPPYAKWGQIAIKKTKEKYPQADIIDYLHIGREKGTEYSTEKFKLWLRQGSKEFGVFVAIKFENETEQIINFNIVKQSIIIPE